MGFIHNAGAVEIGESAVSSGHPYQFSQFNNRLYCVLKSRRLTGEIYESRNEGLNWQLIDDVGPVISIAIRGNQINFQKSDGRLGAYNLTTGFATAYTLPWVWTGIPIPLPEVGGGSGKSAAIRNGSFFNLYAFLDYEPSVQIVNFEQFPGRDIFALWGTEGVGAGAEFICIAYQYTDPNFEVSTYPVFARRGFVQGVPISDDWEYFPPRLGRFRLERPHTYTNFLGRNYEGFVNGRASFEGVGARSVYQIPSLPALADHWSGVDNNQAPLYYPDAGSPDLTQKFPIASIPAGSARDAIASRGAVMGSVSGRKTFGMIEPGYGFAHCYRNGSGDFVGRKFLGNLSKKFVRSTLWMPYSSGIFGMGFFAGQLNTAGSTAVWIYDKEPAKIPTSALVDNGFYTDREGSAVTSATVLGSKYYRW